jgi:hypothetical protein
MSCAISVLTKSKNAASPRTLDDSYFCAATLGVDGAELDGVADCRRVAARSSGRGVLGRACGSTRAPAETSRR